MIWYLEIEWAGGRWLWLSGGELPTGASASVAGRFEPPGWSQEAAAPGEAPPVEGISFELLWDGVAQLEAAGHRVTSAVGELGTLEEGDGWEQRAPLLRGRISAEYGGSGEPVSVRLDPRPWEDSGELLSPAELVDDSTWPSAGSTSEGRGYPLVIGRAGEYQRIDGSVAYCSATPCLPVGSDTVIVANRRVTTSSLTIYSEEDDASEAFAVSLQQDSKGQEVAVCDLSAAATITYDDAYHYWARWPDGGLALATGQTLETGGDVIAWALRRSSLEVDAAALEAIREPLSGFLFGGFMDAPVSPWEWLAKEILPLLPVALLQGPRGLRPLLWRPPSAVLACDLLVVDQEGIARDGRILSAGEEINDLTLRYAWRARTGEYLRSRRISGARAGQLSSDTAVAAYRQAGEIRRGQPVETQWVYDIQTVDRILLSLIEIMQPKRRVAIVGPLSRMKRLRPFDCVLLSDSSVHISECPALVRRVEWGAADCRLLLEI